MRLFFAVPIADDVRKRIYAAARGSWPSDPPWRWIPWDNYHLTMKFLGEVDLPAVEPLCLAAREVARRVEPFRIRFGRFGALPDPARPRVLYYEAEEGAPELSRLSELVSRAVEPLGFPVEKRPFLAHLTLARVKIPPGPRDRERLRLVPPLPGDTVSPVDRFELVKSTLERSGAVYDTIERFPLAGPGPGGRS
ncbi:MAG: RNA 2',3'-cyclic phosphodiesterase [Candidatus Krumholzibacteria bacterium]|nr:RNA 2',3'-cyclic phosphodiesterase [Candidatus Krumholzibacteria bacterium]